MADPDGGIGIARAVVIITTPAGCQGEPHGNGGQTLNPFHLFYLLLFSGQGDMAVRRDWITACCLNVAIARDALLRKAGVTDFLMACPQGGSGFDPIDPETFSRLGL
jgi:hypothetical protein